MFYSGECVIYIVTFIELDMANSKLDKMSDAVVKKMRLRPLVVFSVMIRAYKYIVLMMYKLKVYNFEDIVLLPFCKT